MGKKEEGVKFLTSRISYISNYFLIALAVIFIYLFFQQINFKIIFFPKNINEAFPIFILLGILILISYLIEEPVLERIIRQYYVTNNEVIKVEGLIRKKRIAIPIQSIADLRVKKGVVGRIFNFGNVEITGFKSNIIMKGMRKPEKIYEMIKEKISKRKLKIEIIK